MTTKDLISRQDAIEGVKELFACADSGNDECDITYMLENLPSADAVEVVRCKDCERYVPQHRRCEWTWLDRNPEDFCSRGERAVREDGEE